ncbi:hypothetical protein ACFLYU_01155 [Candidatus Dependentiae bacterium]
MFTFKKLRKILVKSLVTILLMSSALFSYDVWTMNNKTKKCHKNKTLNRLVKKTNKALYKYHRRYKKLQIFNYRNHKPSYLSNFFVNKLYRLRLLWHKQRTEKTRKTSKNSTNQFIDFALKNPGLIIKKRPTICFEYSGGNVNGQDSQEIFLSGADYNLLKESTQNFLKICRDQHNKKTCVKLLKTIYPSYCHWKIPKLLKKELVKEKNHGNEI